MRYPLTLVRIAIIKRYQIKASLNNKNQEKGNIVLPQERYERD